MLAGAAFQGSALAATEARAAAEEAAVTLRRAITGDYSDILTLPTDTDLDVLHQRDDLRKLMKHLGAKLATKGPCPDGPPGMPRQDRRPGTSGRSQRTGKGLTRGLARRRACG